MTIRIRLSLDCGVCHWRAHTHNRTRGYVPVNTGVVRVMCGVFWSGLQLAGSFNLQLINHFFCLTHELNVRTVVGLTHELNVRTVVVLTGAVSGY